MFDNTQGTGFLLAFVVFLANQGNVDGVFGASMVILLVGFINFVLAVTLFIINKKEHGFALLIMFVVVGLIGFSTCLGAFANAKFH